EYVGRADTQVKVRGFRIELGEIEAVLAEHPAVREAAVTVVDFRPGDRRLVANVVYGTGQVATGSDLRRHLRTKLPDHMVPQHWAELDALPRSAAGKIDRRALVATFKLSAYREDDTPPRTEMEKLVAGIWCDVLGIDSISVHDNFFDLGGHSLLSMRVIARVAEATGRRISPRLMILDTLGQIAAQFGTGVAHEREPDTPESVEPVVSQLARNLFRN
ncbi:MAG TPA: phosphopantetheine-binding protein, partial [Gemmatimonadales bacterium]